MTTEGTSASDSASAATSSMRAAAARSRGGFFFLINQERGVFFDFVFCFSHFSDHFRKSSFEIISVDLKNDIFFGDHDFCRFFVLNCIEFVIDCKIFFAFCFFIFSAFGIFCLVFSFSNSCNDLRGVNFYVFS